MELVQAGRIIDAHGVNGHVKVIVAETHPELLENVTVWRVGLDPHSVLVRRVEECRRHITARGRSLVVRLDGVSTRSDAERLKGALVFVAADEVGGPGSAHKAVQDWVGFSVVDAQGFRIGHVVELRPAPAQDLIVVRKSSGEDVLIPWVAAFVREIDHDTRLITVDLPEGLID